MSNTGQPPEKPTVKFEAPPDWAVKLTENVVNLREDVRTGREETKADFALLAGQFESLESDVRGMQSWRVRIDDRLKSNSLRAQATSSVDLEQDAKLAQALMQLADEKARADRLEASAATKADVQRLADVTATKAEIKVIADAQTTDIVTSVESLSQRNKTVRRLLQATAALAFVAINAATLYLMRPAPQLPQPVPTQVTR